MKTATAALLVATTVACHVWEPVFVSQAGEFSVAFPGKPSYHSHAAEVGAVELTRHMFTHSDDRHTYLVQYVDLTIAADMKPDAVLDLSKDNTIRTLATVGGEILSEERITREGYPGRDWVLQTPLGAARNRVLLVGARLYTLIVGPQAGRTIDLATTMDFFDSFRHVPRSTPRAAGST